MKRLLEIFGLGTLMVIGSSIVGGYSDYTTGTYPFSSIGSLMLYSGIAVFIWGEGLFIWKVIKNAQVGAKKYIIIKRSSCYKR